MFNQLGNTISKWSFAATLCSQVCLLNGCDAPVDAEDQDPDQQVEEYLENPGVLKTDVLRLGNKWTLSGVGEVQGDDEWLRLLNTSSDEYWGGFAAGKFLDVWGRLRRFG
jgi:hypothetical protein